MAAFPEDGAAEETVAASVEVAAPSIDGRKVSGLRLETFAGGRNPRIYKDWKRQVRAVQLCADLPKGRLAVLAWLSLRGEAKLLTISW